MSATERAVFFAFSPTGEGRYRPVTRERSVLFGRRAETGRHGVLDLPRYIAAPPDGVYSRVSFHATSDPFSPEQVVDPGGRGDLGAANFSADGFVPECAAVLAHTFLLAVLASYGPKVAVGNRYIDVSSGAPEHGAASITFSPVSISDMGREIEVVFERGVMRGVQTRGGGACWLPDVLVLPVLVCLHAAPTGATQGR